jgi:hypothetical protein
MMKVADLEISDSDKDTPLHGAAAYSNIEAVKALLNCVPISMRGIIIKHSQSTTLLRMVTETSSML